MPVYDYKCDSCGEAQDNVKHGINRPGPDCPTCELPMVKQVAKNGGFALNGNGWHRKF